MKTITFGLTGSIACGKSTATKTFTANGIPTVDADQVARQVVEPETIGWYCIRSAFGREYLNEDKTLNRTKLGALVFSNKDKLMVLNAIMGPLITVESKSQLDKFHEAGHPIVGYDAALIVEQGNADKFRPLIVVACPLDIQLARLMKRNSLTETAAMNIINQQVPTIEKIKLADHVIDTSGSMEESVHQTELIIKILRDLIQ